MAAVSVLVPFRGDGGGPRDRAWEYVRRWWETTCPGWQLVPGACQPGPWVKASAVAEALTRSDGDTICLADADVLCAGVGEAVEAVQSGAARWAVPHYRVYRLTPEATETVLTGGPLPEIVPGRPKPHRPGRRPREWVAPQFTYHAGALGGGMTVLPRVVYEEVPLDPRFTQWGQEDHSFADALHTLVGPPVRLDHPLWHLDHPPPPPVRRSEANSATWGRMDRGHGNPDGMALRARYRAAKGNPEAMRALIAEGRAVVAESHSRDGR